MAAYRMLSEFLTSDGKRKAIVYKNLDTKQYAVSVYNDGGSSFTSEFVSQDTAEDYAENWVQLV